MDPMIHSQMLRLRMIKRPVFHISELENLELTKAELRSSLEKGLLIQTARDWYASIDAPVDLILATRQGVRLTCASAAKYHQIWAPLHSRLHVYLVHCRPKSVQRSLVVHPIPHLSKWPDHQPVAPLDLTLLHAGRCLPVPEAATLFESAVNKGKILLDDALAIIEELPRHRQDQLSRINPLAQSGTETLVRWFLESRRVKVRAQAEIAGVGHVDILVGESLVIECDSVTYHTDPEQYYRDRYRDQELIRQGYLPVHLTWEDVCLRWELTQERLEGILATRRHRYLRPN